MTLGWLNPTVSRALVVPGGTFYIQYDEGKGEVIFGYAAGQVSFDTTVLRIDGQPCVLADVTLIQDGHTTHTFLRSGENISFKSMSYIGDYTSEPTFSVLLGYTDADHMLYLDVSTTTGTLEYQMVQTPTHHVHYFSAATDLKTYHC